MFWKVREKRVIGMEESVESNAAGRSCKMKNTNAYEGLVATLSF